MSSSSLFANLSHVVKSRDPSLDQRRAARNLVDMVSHILARGRSEGVRIINISSLGVMCRTDAELLIGEHVRIWLPMIKEAGAEVRWIEDGRVGLEFFQPIEPRIYAAMLGLIPPRRTAW
jgi:uncharacterized Zn-finger protein